jgi:hypothetical protein
MMITVRSSKKITRIYEAARLVHKTSADHSSISNNIYNHHSGHLCLTNDNGVITMKIGRGFEKVIVFECAWRVQLQCYAATIFRPGEWIMVLRREYQAIIAVQNEKKDKKDELHKMRFEPIDDGKVFPTSDKKPTKILKICKRCKRETMGSWTGLCFSCARNPHPLSLDYIDSYEWVSPEERS